MKLFIYLFVFSLLFVGCSSRQYYEPKKVDDSYSENVKDLDFNIIDYNYKGATLENYRYISKYGVSDQTLKAGFRFVNDVDDNILAVNDNGRLLINSPDKSEEFKFEKNIVSVSVKDDLVAVSFIDNSIMLFNRKTKEKIFKEYLNISLINDIKIANPVFLNTVVLFPTLDGKIAIVDLKKNEIVKTINLDPKSDINNIIFLEPLGENLVSATTKKIFTFVDGIVNIKDFDTKQIIVKDDHVYIATLDGEIIKFDYKLNKVKSKKFKFANFHTLGYTDQYIYALESQGFLIRLDNDLEDTKVFKFDYDEDEKSIIVGEKLYFENKSVILK